MSAESGIMAVVPALFGLIGTIVGAALTYHSSRVERRAKQDDEARIHLYSVSNAIQRLAWVTKVGAVSPDDASVGPEGISNDLRTSSKDARVALLNAGVPYRIASVALEPAERLALRWGQRKVLGDDPSDAQAVVGFLFDLLDRGRLYRRSGVAWSQLNKMSELGRGRRPLEGISEDANQFGSLSVL
jgi:hypothetical protein